jgi:hypothetical protein
MASDLKIGAVIAIADRQQAGSYRGAGTLPILDTPNGYILYCGLASEYCELLDDREMHNPVGAHRAAVSPVGSYRSGAGWGAMPGTPP